MRFRDIIIYVVCFACSFGMLYLASSQLGELTSARGEMKLVSNEPLENAPPSLAFATVAMGAFRGLIVDILWMRAEQLKEDGQYFDAKQIAEWITLLQPRFASVWDFHGWNMAYNISVAIPASRPQERWHWVKNGYELLRDKGIPKNPKSIELYRSIGWIFQHKIGGVTDDAHKYYKLQIYHMMKPLVEPQTEESYQRLAESPKSLGEILVQPGMAEFLNKLASADTSFSKLSTLVDNYLSLRQQPGRYAPAAFALIDEYRGSELLESFDVFAKAYYLRNTLKLEPELMDELNRLYGPVDYKDPNKVIPLNWLHPDVHAMYWGAKGLAVASEGSQEELNVDRLVFHSLQNLYRRGKMVIYTSRIPAENDPCEIVVRESIFQFPDLRMFQRYDDVLRNVILKYDELNLDLKSLYNAHKNMLKQAVQLFYQGGDKAKALKIYNTLRKEYPDNKDVQVSLVAFVRNRLIGELASIGIHDAREIISLMLKDGYYRYAMGDDDEAYGREAMAKEVYDNYQAAFADESVDRVVLPDFSVLRYVGLRMFLDDEQYPEFVRMNMLERIRQQRPDLYKKLEKHNKFVMQQIQKEQEQKENE
ncbi:MAG: hypothetical protein K8R02_09155 [Anaerohalosphaeraceae bacterium]|nr:hypothetical protein [Anaerohalosphaeraceae bacterium]